MPVATVSTEYERKDLKSAPPDGFIMVRPLPFGEQLKRRDAASRMSMEAQGGNRKSRRSRNQQNGDTDKVNIEMMQYEARLREFSYCIGDHNLTDLSGRTLNFQSRKDVDSLDPRIAAEIETILDELNAEDDEELEDFPKPSRSSSPQAIES